MAVLVEGISVIIRNSALAQRYPGGVAAFADAAPNASYCSDGELARLGFMAPTDVKACVQGLERKGLRYTDESHSAVDLVVVDQQNGFLVSCSWAAFRRVEIGKNFEHLIATCSLRDSTLTTVALPAEWVFETSLSAKFNFVETDKMSRDFEFVRREGSVDVYRERSTGKEHFVARTQ